MEHEFVSNHPLKSGTHRKNSLYCYLRDYEHSAELLAYKIKVSQAMSRQAFFIDVPLDGRLVSPYADFILVDRHLSIDADYIAESSLHAKRAISAFHITLVYQHKLHGEKGIRAHVHLNQHGQLTREAFHVVDCELFNGRVVDTSSARVILARQVELLLAQTTAAQELLHELLRKKAACYSRLELRAAELSELLASAHTLNTPYAEVKPILLEFKQITEQLTAYNEVNIDGRTTYLTGLINQYEAIDRLSADPSPQTIVTEFEVMVQVSVPPKVPSPMNRNDDEQLLDEIGVVVEKIRAIDQDTDLLVRLWDREALWRQLDMLTICVSHQYALRVESLVKTIRSPALKVFFSEAVMSGDTALVKQLYPFVLQKSFDFSALYEQLLTAITEVDMPHLILQEKRIAVADFFYQEAQSYRNFLTLKHKEFRYQSKQQIGLAELGYLFYHDNFPAFDMLLRHGFSADSLQFCQGERALNALQTLIYLYSGPQQLRYIRLLFDYGALMQLTPRYMVKSSLPAHSLLKKTDILEKDWLKLHQMTHLLNYTVAFCKDKHPELIDLLLDHTEIEYLFAYLFAVLTRSGLFVIRHLDFIHGRISRVFMTKQATDEYVALYHSSPGQAWIPCLLFYAASASTDTCHDSKALVYITQQLLTRLITTFTAFSKPEQRRIRDKLLDNTLRARDKDADLGGFLAAQLAGSLVSDPEGQDYEFVLKVLVLMAKDLLLEGVAPYAIATQFITKQPDWLNARLQATKAGENVLKNGLSLSK